MPSVLCLRKFCGPFATVTCGHYDVRATRLRHFSSQLCLVPRFPGAFWRHRRHLSSPARQNTSWPLSLSLWGIDHDMPLPHCTWDTSLLSKGSMRVYNPLTLTNRRQNMLPPFITNSFVFRGLYFMASFFHLLSSRSIPPMSSNPSSGRYLNCRADRNRKKKRPKARFDWHPILSFLKKNEPYLLRAADEGLEILQWFMWKHHFAPVDTSNALAWLNIPANLLPPSRSVINDLPHELLTRVFSLVVHSDSTLPQDHYSKTIRSCISSGSSLTTPLSVGHVCRFWRDIVHGTPTLWSTIVVCSPVQKHVEIASFWLGKTANCPLNLVLEHYTSPDPSVSAIAELFVAQAHRWKRISFTLRVESPFYSLQPNDTPLLEEFRIRLENWDRSHAARFIRVLLSSSTLKTINWGKSVFHIPIPAETPWGQLVDITFHRLEFSQELFLTLSQCQSLKILQLRRMGRVTTTPDFPITLPKVERLVCERPESFGDVFDSFTFPSLNDLEITASPLLSGDMASLSNIVERSGCCLMTLTVDKHAFPILFALPFKRVVVLKVLSGIKDHVLIQMTKRADGEEDVLLPNVRHIFLENCRIVDGVLAAMVWSRREELRTLRVGIDAGQHPKDRMTLAWLKKDGMTVDIHEPIPEFPVFFYVTSFSTEPESDIVPTVYFPDQDTLWS
ncbi:hypothetical protein BDZ97DRAFT_1020179 [Flammula alnicola]|nr:hypothetical protein BDZ97DRAFT_1020179 [Flammula alnicola]